MQHYGGASRGDRSLLDALLPALEALQASVQGDQSASPVESKQERRVGRVDWAAMARAARQGADATAEMAKARAGRSAYVPSAHLVGNSDPGAEAVARVFEALADAAEEAAG